MRIIHRRITDPTWQAAFLIPESIEHNRCFNADFVWACTSNEAMAYDVFFYDFARLNLTWQLNLSGRSHEAWVQYEKSRLGVLI